MFFNEEVTHLECFFPNLEGLWFSSLPADHNKDMIIANAYKGLC